MFCIKCGTQNPEGATYCVSCGAEVGSPSGAPASPVTPHTSGLAIASLVLGILGLCCVVTPLVGLILGMVSLSQIRKSQGQLQGRGLAIAGIAVSAGMLVLVIISAICYVTMGGTFSDLYSPP